MNAFADVSALPSSAAEPADIHEPWPQSPGPQAYGFIVDLLPQGILLAQADRRLLAANLVARRLMGDGAIRVANGLLSCVGQICALRLDRLLAQATAGSALDCAVWFERSLSTGQLHISASRHPLAHPDSLAQAGAVLLVVQVDQPALTQSARIDALSRQCRFSPTERHVLMLLADGMTVELASQHLGLQLSTLRSHVRNLLGKSQAPSLMQLLRWTGSAQTLPH